MAYRKKAGFILKYKPDILIVPECEHPDKLKLAKELPAYSDLVWYGDNPNKGICVFSFGTYKLKLLDIHQPDYRIILPIQVIGEIFEFTLLAVWAYNPNDPSYKYIGQVWKAILHYENILKNGRVIIAGDFNSNVLWDKLKRKISHSMVVDKLASIGIHSAYHYYLNLTQGSEQHPTFFLYRHLNKPYHIDYCFASQDLIQKLESVEVGNHSDCSIHSDHNPLIATFNI